ncbi:diadenylate cyclase [Neobacillus sp. WH10]|uniref:DNA integrity scanning protein DisA nucleotide-binding domain protein n=1 Tax=Neobacillus sp. WH10 TaxID=3047873 RepID=UPI0024C1EAB1|nr:diadenylate cyclase [Neobacillus sp. WH10]WHY79938.1 diadenylate cyclase [Neobacillus sp. WH10]
MRTTVTYFHFDLLYKDNVLMQVSYGIPKLPKPKVNKEKFFDDVARKFDVKLKSIEHLWSLIKVAIQQKHGTMIVISGEAEKEALRLANQSTLIKPQKVDKDLMAVITSIDGAVLIDRESVCYSIGVILDGVASENGDPSRGARFNSAIRYIDYIEKEFKHKVLIVIVSEDGYVDIIPNLKPRIEKSLLLHQIGELKELSELNLSDRDNNFRRDFYHLMNWFEVHEFYLSQIQCDEINNLRVEIQNSLDGIHIIFNTLKANDLMDESYFI